MISPEIKEVVDFIRRKSEKLKIFKWTDEEIAAYFLEKNKLQQVVAIYRVGKPAGIIFFSLLSQHYMYIEQIWCEDREIMRIYLKILVENFPNITHLNAYHQRRKRPLTITVKDFIRIYG